jgi:hydrogenase maturation protease
MILIIAYGNSLRRDDGAGLKLAELLEREWRGRGLDVRCESVHQLTPELAELVADDRVSAVVFTDARVAEPGVEDLEIQVRRLSLPTDSSPGMGHHFDPAVVMAYAFYLYSRTPPAWLVTVPGVDFDHGEGLSEAVRNVLDGLPAFLNGLPPDWPLCGSGD